MQETAYFFTKIIIKATIRTQLYPIGTIPPASKPP